LVYTNPGTRCLKFVLGLRRSVSAVALVITLSTAGLAQNDNRQESYDIWSTVLRIKEPMVTAWMIVRQTRGFELCLKPAQDQESTYREMFDDYAAKNKEEFVLERNFKLPLYTLVPPLAWTTSSALNTFAVVSAVGFNRGRTRAVVCLWGRDSGTCYVLITKGGMWQLDGDWHGNGCFWAA
jgi:hypothetical protein